MNKIDALNELTSLVEKGIIKYTELEHIKNLVKQTNLSTVDVNFSKELLSRLVDDGSLSSDAYDALKQELVAFENSQKKHQQAAPTSSATKEPFLKGFLIGFVLGIFVNVIGLVLGIIFGDESCKKGAITGFCISIVLSIVFTVLSFFFFKDFLIDFIKIITDSVPPADGTSEEAIAALPMFF